MKSAYHGQIKGLSNRGALTVFLVVLALGCQRETTAKTEESANGQFVRARPEVTGRSFGTTDLGFVSWLESHGNFVVVHQFDQDTNGDGAIAPKFGDHGEPVGDLPSVWTYPLPTGDGERWDEFITSDPQNRWAVLRRGEELVAVSTHKRWALSDADTRPDPSPCSAARQASIDPTGRWLVYLRAAPERAVVMDLMTGHEREVPAQDLLWRAHAMPGGWVMLREVSFDTDGSGALEMPRREGTCICRWCSRFASSVGTGRLVGDAHREVVITPTGERVGALGAPIGIGTDAIWSMAKGKLFTLEGKRRKLADDCQMGILPLGDDTLILRCRAGSVLWNATTDAIIPLKLRIGAVEVYTVAIDNWVIATTLDEGGNKRIARVNLNDGRVEEGPRAVRIGPPHPSGWRLLADDTRLHAFDLTTGTSVPIELRASELAGLLAKTNDGWVPTAPSKPTVLRKLPDRPEFVAANGCYVEPSARGATRGPHGWVCP